MGLIDDNERPATQYSYEWLAAVCEPESDMVWRLEEKEDGSVEAIYIGFGPIDSDRIKLYANFGSLPEWMQDRVAVLRMMPCDPHESVVFGVGRRIAEETFWVVQ